MEIGRFDRDLDRLFDPRSIAVIGASNVLGKWGLTMSMNIIGGGYNGRLYMVNPHEKSILGHPTYPTLSAIEEPVDVAIVAIPAKKVMAVLEEAIAKGIKNLVVVSSNFSEVSGEGTELELELARLADVGGATIVGPNTMGLYSASSSLCAVGTFVYPLKGHVGFISQSGNLGVQLLEWGESRGVGFSRFVGSGNEANTGMAEFLEYLGSDPETEAIALYMEGLEDGRRFLEVARRVTRSKPVIVLKGGRGEQGSRAALSHSGSLAGENELFEGLFEQAGIVTADTSEEFIDLVTAFSSLPVPRGGKVAIVTMGGGWGVVAADACDREGVELATLPQGLLDELDTFLPQFWSHGNPVDLVGGLRRANHFRAIDAVTRSESVDIVILMGAMLGKQFFMHNLVYTVVRPLYRMLTHNIRRLPAFLLSFWKGFSRSVSSRNEAKPEGSAGINPAEAWEWTDSALISHLENLIAETGKPIIAVAMSEQQKSTSSRLEMHGILTTPTPERAVYAAAKLSRYRDYLFGSQSGASLK
jgi:acyl-CoA synthetase (NDP forming)